MEPNLKDRIVDELTSLLGRRLGDRFDAAREIVLSIDGERIIIKANHGGRSNG